MRWIRDRSFAIKNADGEVHRIAGIAQDFTTAKQLETQLRSSELRHRALVELSPHAVFDNCDDKIVFANQACVKLFGAIAPSQLFGKPVMDFIHPDSRPIARERMARIRSMNGTSPSTEERFVGLDGSVIEVEVAAAAIRFEEIAGYTCLDVCEPEGEVRVYSPGGNLDSQIPLGPLGSDWYGPHDIAWSPAGYAVVAPGELQGQSYVFKVQAFAPNVYEPLWTFIPNDKQGLQIASAVAVGSNGEVYGGGIGATNHPAFAVIGG